ncbi:MAG: UDP-N-acetylglucosamine--N-acetylmuramyl-(pentapeptide) pyrophosphoryl-undecaprenol N-acetylglucosamine transferase [Candidatus Peribacteraceae bacterium]|nr:UDP-N-acetylglucosamine--N-acetylmuramyl-(pentapeptide) pyrophosphoryl-undecaprenol N-acetylglucosamine transferase [Candidatus Peribacteraceae bacterium]
MNILFAAGGSIGHIAPCIAVWRAVQKIEPAAEAHFVCSTRPEDQTFLQKEGMAFTALGGRGVSLATLPAMMIRAWQVIAETQPDVLFTKGGGVTIPMAFACWMKHVPIVVHESDAVPGRATRMISRWAKVVCHGFPSSFADKERFTGNPVRHEISQGSRDRGLQLTGFTGNRPILLVLGGSQGATTINEFVAKNIDALLACADVIHITGEGKQGALTSRPEYWTRPFVHEDLSHLYAIASMALSRAGAGSIGELAANGIPAILVPLEGVAHDHQVKNAEAAVASGGCILTKQTKLDTEMMGNVRKLAEHSDIRSEMSANMRRLHTSDADVAIAKILLASVLDHGVVP